MFETKRPARYGRRGLLRTLAQAGALVAIAKSRAAWAADSEVTIDNFKFSPSPLTVKAGTKVTWVNRDDMVHSIVFPSLNLHSDPLDSGDAFAHRFDQAGTYDYLCGLHPFMHGRLIVQS